MTLTELRYILALAQEKHFGRAAEICGVAQPSLSVAVKKLEEELKIKIFERRSNEVTPTPIGTLVLQQAQRVIESAEKLRECAEQGRDPLSGPLRLGVIYTIAPFLLPQLVTRIHAKAPTMPLVISENYTADLLEALKTGQIDCAILSLPVQQAGLMMQPLYDEDFVVAVPADHPIADNSDITREQIASESMLLLGSGHCFRDQILNFCADAMRTDANGKRTLEGTSVQTIVYMVAQGLGVTIIPSSAQPVYGGTPGIKILPFLAPGIPRRRVALVWRKSFPRTAAVEALRDAVSHISLPGCRLLTSLPPIAA